MTEFENLYSQKIALEYKDHWTAKDWANIDQLNKKISELDQPKPQPKQEWYTVYMVMRDGYTRFSTNKYFNSKAEAEKWIEAESEHSLCGYDIQEL